MSAMKNGRVELAAGEQIITFKMVIVIHKVIC